MWTHLSQDRPGTHPSAPSQAIAIAAATAVVAAVAVAFAAAIAAAIALASAVTIAAASTNVAAAVVIVVVVVIVLVVVVVVVVVVVIVIVNVIVIAAAAIAAAAIALASAVAAATALTAIAVFALWCPAPCASLFWLIVVITPPLASSRCRHQPDLLSSYAPVVNGPLPFVVSPLWYAPHFPRGMTCPPLLLLRRQVLPVSQRLSTIVAVVAIVVIVVIVVRCAISVAVVVR
jgi:hypothetical protein